MTDHIQALIDKVKGGSSRLVVEAYAEEAFPPDRAAYNAGDTCTLHIVGKAYKGSLDAARDLHDSLLPENKTVEITDLGNGDGWSAKINWEHMEWKPTFTAVGPFGFSGISDDPARAWLLAILKACQNRKYV